MSGATLTLERLREDIVELLEDDSVEVEEGINLLDLGLDSIRIMVLAERWSERTGRTVEFASLAEEPELGAWWRYLSGGTG